MITTCWEPGTQCLECGVEFEYGEEMLHGRHPRCAQMRSQARDDSVADVAQLARERLLMPGRLTFTARQLRQLVMLSGLTPVRKPDAGKRVPLYGRMPGWSAARVNAGLDAPQVCGLWLDFLDVGKIPPVRHCDVEAILDCIRPAQTSL